MKKIFIFILVLTIGIFGYYLYTYINLYNILKNINESFYINNYSIFGIHLNIEGCIDKNIQNDLKLVLKNNKDEIKLDTNFYNDEDKTCFYISDKNNDGIYLDGLKRGKYLLLIKQDNKYYTLKNDTAYDSLEYYTITRNHSNNKIGIKLGNILKKDYVFFNIKKEIFMKDIYDISIDPGHGGKDVGAIGILNNREYYESNITLDISLLLKKELEKLGLKVKLTREDDSDLNPYGEQGRAVMPNKYKTKYSLSIHLNSTEGKMNYGGVEVYTPNDIDYTFASLLADNISNIVNYSKKKTDRVLDGVYFTYFNKKNIKDSNKSMKENNMKPYDIKVGAPTMYMIRELGGINTYAYIDGRNDKYGLNKYYNSNNTTEPYLIELGYINYELDLIKLVKNKEEFAKAISKSIKEYLEI